MLSCRLTEDHTGIVDQDIDAGLFFFDLFDKSIQVCAVSEIGLVCRIVAAEGTDLFLYCAILQRQGGGNTNDTRAGFRQSQSHGAANSFVTSGNKGYLSAEIKK